MDSKLIAHVALPCQYVGCQTNGHLPAANGPSISVPPTAPVIVFIVSLSRVTRLVLPTPMNCSSGLLPCNDKIPSLLSCDMIKYVSVLSTLPPFAYGPNALLSTFDHTLLTNRKGSKRGYTFHGVAANMVCTNGASAPGMTPSSTT
jgi:hypothetical protein